MSETLKVAIIGNSQSPHVKIREQKFRQTESIDVKIFDSSDFFPQKSQRLFSIKNIFLRLPKMNTIAWLVNRYQAIRRYKADVVFIMYADHYSLLLSLFFRSKIVISTWGGDILVEQGAMRNGFERKVAKMALQKADQIYCVSEHLKEHVARMLEGKKRAEPRVVIYGVDLDDYAMGADSSGKSNLLCSGKETPFVIYSPRWCLPIYNIAGIADSFAELHKKEENIRLAYRNVDIPGSDDANAYYKTVYKKLEANGLLQKSETVGLVDKQTRINRYKTSHVVISLSHSDGTPLTVLEAMALGKIVVCNRLPSLEAIIEDGVNGFLVDGTKPTQVANKLLYIKKNYGDLEKTIGKSARQFVKKNANIDAEIRTYVSSFRQLTGKR